LLNVLLREIGEFSVFKVAPHREDKV
jgi:hypothetical protein